MLTSASLVAAGRDLVLQGSARQTVMRLATLSSAGKTAFAKTTPSLSLRWLHLTTSSLSTWPSSTTGCPTCKNNIRVTSFTTKSRLSCFTPKRNMLGGPSDTTNNASEPANAAADPPEVDPDDPSGEIAVYRGILSTQIRLVKAFSLMTSVIGLAFQPVLFYQAQSGQAMGVILATGAFISFFTFATPLLIHSVSKKYVTALYYNEAEDSYTAVTYSILLRPKKLKFRVGDVHVPDIPGAFTTFKANNVPLFVDGQQFYLPQHFGKIMGYDKPINFRWKQDNEVGRTSERSTQENTPADDDTERRK